MNKPVLKRTAVGLDVERRLHAVFECFGLRRDCYDKFALDDFARSIRETRHILRSNKRLKPLSVLAERLTDKN